MGASVRLEVADEGVGMIRLDRPKVNALNAEVAHALDKTVDDTANDDAVRAVVVWGGPRVFAAGADIKEMAELDAVSMYTYIGLFQDVLTRLAELPKITVAAINGYALGGGCELALACDFRIAASDAQLGQPEIALGVIPGAGGTQRLPRLVGMRRAKELILSGRVIDADESHDIGLVDRVVPAADVMKEAEALARRYARGPTVALAAAKQAIQRGGDMDMTGGLILERQAFASLFATEDQRIGMSSFVEQGPGKARFVGR
ncbi:MAG: enoyl-CoA hydratase/isomerase family protein [Actinomycetota bacterium]